MVTKRTNKSSSFGFSLIELLVVIGIIGVLLALLIPAVMMIRESSRRADCQARMRQIGIALHQYIDAHGCFPQGQALTHDRRHWGADHPCDTLTIDKSAHVRLLPYIEGFALYDALNDQVTIHSSHNLTIHAHVPGLYVCPGDTEAELTVLRDPARHTLYQETEGVFEWRVAATSYIGSLGMVGDSTLPGVYDDCKVPALAYEQVNGVMVDISPLRPSAVVDGMSKTIAFFERDMGEVERATSLIRPGEERAGIWYIGSLGNSLGHALRPPNFYRPGTHAAKYRAGSGAVSTHWGIINALFADGSVHAISTSIDSWPIDNETQLPVGADYLPGTALLENAPPRGIWQALHTRAGGETDHGF